MQAGKGSIALAVAAGFAVAGGGAAAVAGLSSPGGPEAQPAPVSAPASATTVEPGGPRETLIASPSRAVVAEMDRRQGIPKRVAKRYARRARIARAIARREAARRAAARRAAAARERARRQARERADRARAEVNAESPIWWDPRGAQHQNTDPDPAAREWIQSGRGAWLDAAGYARAPVNAPSAVKRAIQAANQIARSPYLWGGGHGRWQDRGYDCSGSVSYVLASGGMLSSTMNSTRLMSWGSRGPGRWLTVYANHGHTFMVIAGLRFDTSGASRSGSRWQLDGANTEAYAVRHFPGL